MTHEHGAPVYDNEDTMTAGVRGPMLAQDAWYLKKTRCGGYSEGRMHIRFWCIWYYSYT